MKIEVYDDFFDEDVFSKIRDIVESTEFQWSRSSIINRQQYPKNLPMKFLMEEKYNHQFVHYLYSEWFPTSDYTKSILMPFKEVLENNHPIRAILRAKVNFNSCTETVIEHALHHDYDVDEYPDLKTLLFYVNTNDGYTLFEDGDKIPSVANRCVLIKGNILHTGTNCTDDFGRLVIAINYL